ncbi:MAG: flavin reductase family protein [Pseudolabrys sp.]
MTDTRIDDRIEEEPSIARERFLGAMGRVFSSVSIVTTDGPAGRFAITVSSAGSASADPPLILACIHERSPVNAAIVKNGVFSVNVLSVGQEHLSDCFAGRPREGLTPFDFDSAEWLPGKTGVPLLKGSVAAFDCMLHSLHQAGSHTVFFGRVVEIIEAEDSTLIYGRRAYTQPLANKG